MHCGYQNPARNNFCAKCGQGMHTVEPAKAGGGAEGAIECSKCGHPNARTARFCAGCSHPLVEDFKLKDEEDFVLVKINLSQLDFESHKDLSHLTRRVKNPRILVDMNKVKWIDSTGIGALVTLANRFARTGQEMKMYGVTPKVMESFKALQVDNILEMYDVMNEALVSWGLPPR